MGFRLALTSLLLLPLVASAQDYQVTRVASGLSRIVYVTAPPGDMDRLFIVEQHTGQIKILDRTTGTVLNDPFLTVPGISTGSEQGLLSLAFPPLYDPLGFFYVYKTDPDTKVVRYKVSATDPNLADPGSGAPVLSIDQPQANHNGGWMAFGGDGYLYIATGDGGSGNDIGTGHTAGIGNAQDIEDNLLGKILRIDVSSDAFPNDPDRNYSIPPSNPFVDQTGDDEIWTYGLRNPWRASFDRATGDLYIGDVGQNNCEEVNVQPDASPGGENYGWRLREGTLATPTGGVGGVHPPGAIDPVIDYPHPGVTCSGPGPGYEGISVTGGYVYRGPIQEFQGRYFFADYGTGKPWSFLWDGSDPTTFDGTNYTDLTDHSTDPKFLPDQGTIGLVSSFGEDDAGNLFIVDIGGEVFMLPEPGAAAGLAGLGAIAGLARRRERR
jgi:glucose/arabinose dehydrogenase